MRRVIIAVAAVAVATCATPTAHARELNRQQVKECRYQHLDRPTWTYRETVRTIRCFARRLDPIGGVDKALDTWHCESGWGLEPADERGSSFHGPYQWLRSSFAHAFAAHDGVRRWYELKPNVHNVRSNVAEALATARYTWSPWSCA